MLARDNLNILRFLSGVYGLASLFLPWWIEQSQRNAMLLPLWAIQSVFRPVPYYILTQISALFTITFAIIILGCFTAFLSSLTGGKDGRLLAFSSGISFSLAPVIFIISLNLLLSSIGMISWGTYGGVYSTSVSSGFFMAFVAAVTSFLSLGNVRRLKFFLSIWAVQSIVLFLIWGVGFHVPSDATLLIVSALDSLIFTSVATFLYGMAHEFRKVLKKK